MAVKTQKSPAPTPFTPDEVKTFAMFAETGLASMMKLELKENPALANAKDKDGTPMLHIAVQWGHENAMDMLLKFGADPRIPNEFGETAQSLAERLNFTPLAEKLKKRTGEINAAEHESKRKKEFNAAVKAFRDGNDRTLLAPERPSFRPKSPKR